MSGARAAGHAGLESLAACSHVDKMTVTATPKLFSTDFAIHRYYTHLHEKIHCGYLYFVHCEIHDDCPTDNATELRGRLTENVV